MYNRKYHRKTVIVKQETDSFSKQSPQTAVATVELKNGRGKINIQGPTLSDNHAYLIAPRKGENKFVDVGTVGSVFNPDDVAGSGMSIEDFDVLVLGRQNLKGDFPSWSFVGYMDKKREWRRNIVTAIKEDKEKAIEEVTQIESKKLKLAMTGDNTLKVVDDKQRDRHLRLVPSKEKEKSIRVASFEPRTKAGFQDKTLEGISPEKRPGEIVFKAINKEELENGEFHENFRNLVSNFTKEMRSADNEADASVLNLKEREKLVVSSKQNRNPSLIDIPIVMGTTGVLGTTGMTEQSEETSNILKEQLERDGKELEEIEPIDPVDEHLNTINEVQSLVSPEIPAQWKGAETVSTQVSNIKVEIPKVATPKVVAPRVVAYSVETVSSWVKAPSAVIRKGAMGTMENIEPETVETSPVMEYNGISKPKISANAKINAQKKVQTPHTRKTVSSQAIPGAFPTMEISPSMRVTPGVVPPPMGTVNQHYQTNEVASNSQRDTLIYIEDIPGHSTRVNLSDEVVEELCQGYKNEVLFQRVWQMFEENIVETPFLENEGEWISVAPQAIWTLPVNHDIMRNSFFIYSYMRYHHVLLGRLVNGDLMIGVPDYYDPMFRVEAMGLGFIDFVCQSKDQELCQLEGSFGYWIKRLD